MVPKWTANLNFSIIREKCQEYRIEPEFLAALVQTESGGNPFAVRAEVKKLMKENGTVVYDSLWKYYYEPDKFAELLGCSKPTEWVGQAMSYGVAQVMGSVARELGFKGWFSELCSWDLGLEYGCKVIRKKMDKYGDSPDTLYAAYNGGSPRKNNAGMFVNQVHVDRFMAFYREITSIS